MIFGNGRPVFSGIAIGKAYVYKKQLATCLFPVVIPLWNSRNLKRQNRPLWNSSRP